MLIFTTLDLSFLNVTYAVAHVDLKLTLENCKFILSCEIAKSTTYAIYQMTHFLRMLEVLHIIN